MEEVDSCAFAEVSPRARVKSQFIMIGSGNPQEGELRPQLLDRFGLSVNVATLQDTDTRVELVMSRMQYEEVRALLGPAPGALS